MKLASWTIVALVGIAGVVAFKGSTYLQQRWLIDRLLQSQECVGCQLQGANLTGLDLSDVNLKDANLQGANLSSAHLGGAVLTNANLTQANLTSADLGCATVNFNLRADQETADVDLTVDSASPAAITQRDHILAFNLDADGQGATMKLNFGGCANFTGANLTGARMPDGSIYQ